MFDILPLHLVAGAKIFLNFFLRVVLFFSDNCVWLPWSTDVLGSFVDVYTCMALLPMCRGLVWMYGLFCGLDWSADVLGSFVDVCTCRALLPRQMCRDLQLLWMYRALLRIYRALLQMYRALLWMYRVLLWMYRALWRMYRALLKMLFCRCAGSCCGCIGLFCRYIGTFHLCVRMC